ncbi:hypothetical protein FRC00_010794 [Tulasnella sp. 408]|nr:hypothetical protein FRC00_010794 [Tulasnella sp. 408]
MTPLLARRHVVWDLLNWLRSNHPGYKDVTLSRENLDFLLPLDSENSPHIPNGVFMSHIPSKARDSESSGYTNEEDDIVEGPSIPTALNGLSLLSIGNREDGNGFAIRRAPSNLRYGTGPLKQYLVQAQQLVIFVLVGRVSYTAFLDNISTVTLNIVPILHEDLQTANGLLAHYSIPQEEPKNYASIRTSARLAKQGLGYKQFSEVYNGTGGIRPKVDMKKYPASQIKKGDLMALELAVKKWTGQGETAEHGSYDSKAILLLRKGTATDEAGVDTATKRPIQNAFSSSFYNTLNN